MFLRKRRGSVLGEQDEMFMKTLSQFSGLGIWGVICFAGVLLLGVDLVGAEKAFSASPGHQSPLKGSEITFAPSIQAMVTTTKGVLYAGSFGMGIFRSDNRGASWETANTGLGDRFILCLGADTDGTVYAGTVRGGVFRTKRDGKSWESIGQGLKRAEVKSLLIHHSGIYAGTGRGVYRWIEKKHHWVVVAEGLDQVLVSSVAMLEGHTLLAGTAGKGLFRIDPTNPRTQKWTMAGERFVDPKERLTHKFIRIVAVGDDQRLYVGTQDGGIFTSVDGGNSWHPIGRSLPNDSIRSIVPTDLGLLVATGRGIFKTIGQDGTWIPLNEGLTELAIQVLIVSNQGLFYAGTSAGAFRSEDQGEHWVNISGGLGTQRSMPRPYF